MDARTPVVPVGPKHPWSKADVLGQGSFGTVYEALDRDGMWFAVKEVSMVENDKQAQQSIAYLMQEIELLSQFKHENVVQFLGTEKEHGKLYIFLELVSKGSLASICKRIQLNHSQISAYTRQILKGLKYLHDRNVVHRDIKCANILVDITGICKLADFGMAKQLQSMDQIKSCKGSAYWMAPEVIDPKKSSGLPADIWSLGCSILEMATGSPPFGDMEWYQVLWTVGHGNAPAIPDTLSETAKDFVKQCLHVNPAKRSTASELLNHPFVFNHPFLHVNPAKRRTATELLNHPFVLNHPFLHVNPPKRSTSIEFLNYPFVLNHPFSDYDENSRDKRLWKVLQSFSISGVHNSCIQYLNIRQ